VDEEKVAVGVNESVASGSESLMASGDVTMDSIKDHTKYESENFPEKYTELVLQWRCLMWLLYLSVNCFVCFLFDVAYECIFCTAAHMLVCHFPDSVL